VLTEKSEAGAPYWECHVGHRYSPSSFELAQAEGVEAALWTAIRALRDRGALLRRMAEHFEGRGQARSARQFRGNADEAYRQAELVRDTLTQATATALAEIGEPNDEAASALSGG
jgi:two-component system chemotaxis response regulator CheB